MTATYTWDVFSTLDGFGSYDEPGDWGGFWGKQGPEFLAHRLAQYAEPMRFVLGAETFRTTIRLLGPDVEAALADDPVNHAVWSQPTTVVSSTLREPLGLPNATLATGDAVEVVARLKEETDTPLRSHGSMRMNRALLAAGLVDLIQVTIFPVLSGRSGTAPLFAGVDDFDLDLVTTRSFDGRSTELTYRPTRHEYARDAL